MLTRGAQIFTAKISKDLISSVIMILIFSYCNAFSNSHHLKLTNEFRLKLVTVVFNARCVYSSII